MQTFRSIEAYNTAYSKSVETPEKFWADIARSFRWKTSWKEVLSWEFDSPNVRWFDGGELNITENCLDRHLDTIGEKTAILWEPNDPKASTVRITYNELHRRVNTFANMLKSKGLVKGDRVCLYMPMVPELTIAMLACARIGVIHSVVFAGFSAKALADRINDATCKVLITADEGLRGAKRIALKTIVNDALVNCTSVKTCIVLKHTGIEVPMVEGRDIWWHDGIKNQSESCEPTYMESEDPLFVLYTSGSTGKPKGVVHTTGGYMVYAEYSFRNVFQYNKEDIYWCTQACPNELVTKHDLSSLRVLGSVGEPINEEAWHWYNTLVGKEKCPIVDTWFQTETGGILISPLAGVTPLKPGYTTLPLPGIQLCLVDPDGQEILGNGVEGNLCIKFPWPSMIRTTYGDHERCKQVYFSAYKGYYFTGDGCKRDLDGMYRITGRVDDVINVSGHRIGTAEVEDAINEHPLVIESAVVGYPHDIKGQGIYAYVICREISNEESFRKALLEVVTREIGPIAKPDKIQVVTGLPKTRSGKIMRRILRKIAEGDTSNLGDISTLIDPSVVEVIQEKAY